MPSSSKFIFSLLVVLTLLRCTRDNTGGDPNTTRDSTITIMTYNIKYDDKSETPTGWEQRKDRVRNLIDFYQPDFLGTQEAQAHQLEYLQANLDPMRFIGHGRDGGQKGEFSALFYNASHFELVENSDSTLWLSPTPGQPGKGWDAAFPRILTWGKFRSNQDKAELYVFNTHLDHVGDTARAESAKMILKTINKIAGDTPVVLTGDFNVTPETQPYAILTGSKRLRDSHKMAETSHIGPKFTFSGFRVDPNTDPRRIDYIFLSKRFSVNRHGAISDFSNGFYPSDHLPVISEIQFNQQ